MYIYIYIYKEKSIIVNHISNCAALHKRIYIYVHILVKP